MARDLASGLRTRGRFLAHSMRRGGTKRPNRSPALASVEKLPLRALSLVRHGERTLQCLVMVSWPRLAAIHEFASTGKLWRAGQDASGNQATTTDPAHMRQSTPRHRPAGSPGLKRLYPLKSSHHIKSGRWLRGHLFPLGNAPVTGRRSRPASASAHTRHWHPLHPAPPSAPTRRRTGIPPARGSGR